MGKRTYKTTEDKFLRLLGERIQHYRVSRKSTQEQFAESIGSNSSYISRVENGQADGLTLQKLIDIADALGVTPAELLEVENVSTSPHSDKRTKRLFLKALSMGDRERALALDLIEAMLERVGKPHTL
jgi:transcriptional regulator with XRE-family HTH domain